uniref:Uncharacterized protein n=1 Tax=viral metagenome TaxID=1070528 RepID=A0A6M3JZ58_9ZZZZ
MTSLISLLNKTIQRAKTADCRVSDENNKYIFRIDTMKKLKLILIWILSTVFAAIIAYIVWQYIDSQGGLYGLLIQSQGLLLILVNLPIPLWASIALVLLIGAYAYLRKHKRSQTYNPRLNDIEIAILLFLSKQPEKLPAEDIAQSLNVNIQIVTFHLEELAKFKMVLRLSYVGSPPDWKLFHEGQRYLIENKLIS